MTERHKSLLAEVGRFVAVAQLATVVALLLFNVLTHGFLTGQPLLNDRPITAYVIANSVGMVVSYHGSRSYAFRDRPPHGADGGITAYVVINLGAMVFPVGCLWFSRTVLGLDDALSDNIAANGIGLVMGFTARFYLFRRFVFPQGPPVTTPQARELT